MGMLYNVVWERPREIVARVPDRGYEIVNHLSLAVTQD